MSSFLNSSQLDNLTGTFYRHWEQFSTGIGNTVTIYKEPIENISNSNSLNMYGYGGENNGSKTDITYTEVSKTIPAMIIYSKDIKSQSFTQIRADITINELFIKVKEEDKNYIMDGKTERALINGLYYDVNPDYNVQNYFGLKFYYFVCTERQ